jgi:hypothetical protein
MSGEDRYTNRVHRLKQIADNDGLLHTVDDNYWVWYQLGVDKELNLSDVINGLYNLPGAELIFDEIYIRNACMTPEPFPKLPILPYVTPTEYGLLMGAQRSHLVRVKGTSHVFGCYGRHHDDTRGYECWLVKFDRSTPHTEEATMVSLIDDKDIPYVVEEEFKEFINKIRT